MKKLIALVLTFIMSLVFINSASAASTFESITVGSRENSVSTSPVDGQGQYGRITLQGPSGSGAFAFVEIYQNGTWHRPNIHEHGFGWLWLSDGVSEATNNYYMEKGKKYRLSVSTSDYSAKAYIRTYD